ncbi:hypothetical protein UYSO10_3342 [Kosakonia radicincitans]|nr:hypothetical protein UYSO10_3342 [Kosakonia radicincitans]
MDKATPPSGYQRANCCCTVCYVRRLIQPLTGRITASIMPAAASLLLLGNE